MLIVKLNKAEACPHCQRTKVVRNGIKPTGRQNFLFKDCTRQFQVEYIYKGCVSENKEVIVKMLCRGSGIRDGAAVTGVSCSTVLSVIKTMAESITLKPKKHSYHRVQIDEQWSYVKKKEKKVWMLYAYAVDEDEIIAFTMGKRSTGTVRNLWVKLKALNIDVFMTDNWEALAQCCQKQNT